MKGAFHPGDIVVRRPDNWISRLIRRTLGSRMLPAEGVAKAYRAAGIDTCSHHRVPTPAATKKKIRRKGIIQWTHL